MHFAYRKLKRMIDKILKHKHVFSYYVTGLEVSQDIIVTIITIDGTKGTSITQRII